MIVSFIILVGIIEVLGIRNMKRTETAALTGTGPRARHLVTLLLLRNLGIPGHYVKRRGASKLFNGLYRWRP